MATSSGQAEPQHAAPFTEDQIAQARQLLASLRERSLMMATAESCTGGLLAAALTEIPGSSDVLDRGFVTYSNEAKIEMLGVHPDLIATHGAVSPQVARAMAEGALIHSQADIAIAITGIAGPGGGTPAKPVGLVHLAAAGIGCDPLLLELRLGDIGRSRIRLVTVTEALTLCQQLLDCAADSASSP